MTLSSRRAGEALVRATGELVRAWRSARAQARPAVSPGLVDGVVEDFLVRAGEGLAARRDPALVWPACQGVVRLDPRALDRSRAEHDAEWDLVEQVLASACLALDAEEGVREWLARALVIARAGSRALDGGGGPRGVLLVWSLGGFRPTRPARAGGRP